MSRDAYELLALGARYVFAGLMVLIALRAARLTAVDSRRAAKLRRLSPMTGLSGELMVLEGDGKAPRGMRYPVIREGMIGSARSCDVRIRHASVRRRHACFQLTEQGLSVRDHAGARLRDGDGEVVREMTLLDGDSFWVGRIHLLLVLSNATAAQSRRAPEDLFATRRKEDWDGEEGAYDDEDWHGEGAAYGDENWVARAEARSRDDFDEEQDWADSEPAFSRNRSYAGRMRGESRVHAANGRGSTRYSEDWSDHTPHSILQDSTFDGEGDYANSALRTSYRTDARRSEKRRDGVLYSRGLSSRGSSDDFDRTSSVHSDLHSRDARSRASRSEESPLPGITRDSASRDDNQHSPEPSISRESKRSHASAPRDGLRRSAQPRVREGICREPEPPDDLFMDDL